MNYIFLSQEFYSQYPQENFPEIERKDDRPYSMIELDINDYKFALPLRSSAKHKWKYCLPSKKDSGLDFKKAIYIYDSKFISDTKPHLRQNDYNYLKGKDKIIEHRFMLYLKEYVKAVKTEDLNKQGAVRCSTLSYFSDRIDYEQLVNQYFKSVF